MQMSNRTQKWRRFSRILNSLADLGRRNQERAIQQFSIENMVAKYEQLYFTLAGW